MSMKVDYPETAFIIMMFLGKKKTELIVPLDLIYETAKKGILALERNQKRIEKFPGKRKIIGATIIQMKLKQLIELKPQYWANSIKNEFMRFKIFNNLDFLSDPKLYQYMVVPRSFDEKTKEWSIAVSNPFYLSDDNSAIVNYILSSDQAVDPRAKHAATYVVEKMWGMNWKTKEVQEVDPEMISEVSKELIN